MDIPTAERRLFETTGRQICIEPVHGCGVIEYVGVVEFAGRVRLVAETLEEAVEEWPEELRGERSS